MQAKPVPNALRTPKWSFLYLLMSQEVKLRKVYHLSRVSSPGQTVRIRSFLSHIIGGCIV